VTCPDCKTGVLSRNKKPDALGRIIERCDSCNHRRVVDAPDAVPALSGSVVRAANGNAPDQVAQPAPVAVVGQPCPCCHRAVKKLPICEKCKKNRRVLGKTKCEECSRPRSLAARFCVKCGEKFTPTADEKLSGTAAYRCPKHRAAKRPVAVPA
jgi:hypothetical protein